MLFKIAFIVMAFSVPFFCFLSFKVGLKCGAVDQPEPKVPIFHKKYTPSPEVERINKELQNIDNYQGDGTGQVKL